MRLSNDLREDCPCVLRHSVLPMLVFRSQDSLYWTCNSASPCPVPWKTAIYPKRSNSLLSMIPFVRAVLAAECHPYRGMAPCTYHHDLSITHPFLLAHDKASPFYDCKALSFHWNYIRLVGGNPCLVEGKPQTEDVVRRG